FIFYYVRSLRDLVHPDVGWMLWIAGRLLDGGRLYHDVVDMNPPLIHYATTLPVALARSMGWPEVLVFKVFVLAIAAVSLVMCSRLINTLFESVQQCVRQFLVFVLA